jgi:hypothetical protein
MLSFDGFWVARNVLERARLRPKSGQAPADFSLKTLAKNH